MYAGTYVSLNAFICLYTCISLSVYISLPAKLHICLTGCLILSIYLFACLSIYLPTYLHSSQSATTIYLSICFLYAMLKIVRNDISSKILTVHKLLLFISMLWRNRMGSNAIITPDLKICKYNPLKKNPRSK